MKQVLVWDFFGPDARRTAEHFHRHLLERLEKERLTVETVLLEERVGQCGVLCRCEPDAADAIQRLLRPQGRADAAALEEAYPNVFVPTGNGV
jgi:hypothetical protein